MITRFADALMRAVINSAPTLVSANVDAAVRILREEAKALIIPGEDSDGRYAEARESVLAGSIHEGYVLSLVAATVIERLAAEAA